jgi:hypothetical protein
LPSGNLGRPLRFAGVLEAASVPSGRDKAITALG